MVKYCETCGLFDPKQNICRLSNLQKNPSEDFCSNHVNDLLVCEVCGKWTLQPVYDLLPDGNFHILCLSCAKQRHTCIFCKNNVECVFQTDPSPLPKTIVKAIQQNNMFMQQQVLNPDRIEITCKKKCKCFNSEIGCSRQITTCSNQDFCYPHHER